MTHVQQYRAIIAADKDARKEQNNSLDAQIAQARKRMGETRWAEVNRQWNDPTFIADRTSFNAIAEEFETVMGSRAAYDATEWRMG